MGCRRQIITPRWPTFLPFTVFFFLSFLLASPLNALRSLVSRRRRRRLSAFCPSELVVFLRAFGFWGLLEFVCHVFLFCSYFIPLDIFLLLDFLLVLRKTSGQMCERASRLIRCCKTCSGFLHLFFRRQLHGDFTHSVLDPAQEAPFLPYFDRRVTHD